MAENTAPEQIIINGQEYSLDDVAGLVEKGRRYDDIEKQTNTSLDKVFPEFTKSRQQIKDYEEQLAERTRQVQELQDAQRDLKVAETPEEVKKAKEALRQLGGVDEDFLGKYLKDNGYMTKEEAAQERLLQQQTEALDKEGSRLEAEIDGSDGRVPFHYKSVVAYANAYRKDNLMDAYNEMNERGNAKWTSARLAEEEAKKGLTTIRAASKKKPETPRITSDNLSSNLDELIGNTLGKE